MANLDETYHRFFATPVLPLTPSLEIDEPGYRRLLRMYLDDPRFKKRGGIIANSEAGEIFYLTPKQRQRIVEIHHAGTDSHAALGMLARLLARAAAREFIASPSEIPSEGACAYPATAPKDERRRGD